MSERSGRHESEVVHHYAIGFDFSQTSCSRLKSRSMWVDLVVRSLIDRDFNILVGLADHFNLGFGCNRVIGWVGDHEAPK